MATFVPGTEQSFTTPTVTVDGGLAVGTYTFQLIVDDASGKSSAPKTVQITIVAQPVANFSFNPAAPAPITTFTLDGSASVSPGGSISAYRWTLLPQLIIRPPILPPVIPPIVPA
jgi:PKD repeat protein